MRWSVVWLAMVACVEDEGWIQEVGEASAYLVDDPAAAFPERARLLPGGEARFSPDGEVLTPVDRRPRWGRALELVVVDAGPEVRVLYEGHTSDLLVYVARYDLEDVLWKSTFATAGPEGGTSGVRLPAGFPVDTSDEVDGGFTVVAENRAVEVEVWVPDSAVDQVWDEPLPEIRAFVPDLHLPGETEIFDRPEGRRFATIQPSSAEFPRIPWAPAQRTGQADGDFFEVIVDAGGWRLRGWIRTFEPTLALGGHGTLSYGYGCSMAFAELPTEAIVPRGTWLYDAPGGDAVGRVTHDTLYVDAPGEDHVAITELTPWGSVPLWVEPWDVLPVEPLAP